MLWPRRQRGKLLPAVVELKLHPLAPRLIAKCEREMFNSIKPITIIKERSQARFLVLQLLQLVLQRRLVPLQALHRLALADRPLL